MLKVLYIGGIIMKVIISPKQLSGTDLFRFEEEYNDKKRYSITSWLFFLLLGGTGAHRFYLRDINGGLLYIINLLLMLLSVTVVSAKAASAASSILEMDYRRDALAGIMAIVFTLAFLTNCTFWIIDLFRLPKLIYKTNKKIEKEILMKIIK